MRRALLLCLALACVRARPVDQQQWIELQTQHFLLRTDLDESRAREVVQQLELVRASLIDVAWHAQKPMQGRLTVVALADSDEFHELVREGVEGFVTADAFGADLVVMSAERPPEELLVLKHEMAHVLSNEFLLRSPRWVAEGIACYLETLRFDNAKHTVVAGEPHPGRVHLLSSSWPPNFRAVMEAGSEIASLSPEEGVAFESAAWLLVHDLANRRAERFSAFLGRLARAEDPKKAFAAEFPDLVSDDALLAEMDNHIHHGEYTFYTRPQPSVTAEASLRSLPRSEVHAMRADLLRVSPGSKRDDAKIKAELALALQDDPGNPLALELSQGADVDAAPKAHPDDWRAWLVYAQRHDNDGPALQKAVKLAPDNALVLALLAWSENAAGRRKKAIEYARKASDIAPGHSMHLDTLASLLAGAGRCGEALATERRAIEVLPDTAPGGLGQELRARLTQMELKCGKTPAHLEIVQEERPDTEPVRKTCTGALGVSGPATVTAEYTVREDGSVGEIEVTGKAPQDVLRAFRSFLKTCSYEPATKDGKPVAARMRQDLTVGKR